MKLARWILVIIAALALAVGQAPRKGGTSKPAAASQSSSTSKSSSNLIDINSASAAELKSLPGIGDAYSAAIIKNRPYANKRQLLSRKVVPQATYDKISDQIIAKQKK